MKISIVLATYNGEKYIERQLLSILNQTVLPNEIIVTDDGSTDRTLDIVNKYKNNSNIEWIITKNTKKGFVSNFFNGISKSTGEVIFLSDQDDEWKNKKIEKHISIYKQYSNVKLVHGEIDIVNLENNILKKSSQGYLKGVRRLSFDRFLQKPNYPGMSMSFQRDLFFMNKNFIKTHKEEIKTHDYLLVMFAAVSNGLYTLSECLCNRTYTGENVALRLGKMNKLNKQQRIESSITNILQYNLTIDFLKNSQKNDQQIKEVQSYLNTQILRYNFLNKKNLYNSNKYFLNIITRMSLKSFIADLISF